MQTQSLTYGDGDAIESGGGEIRVLGESGHDIALGHGSMRAPVTCSRRMWRRRRCRDY
jgi:hypothetical protein